jgi:hypothetical protein
MQQRRQEGAGRAKFEATMSTSIYASQASPSFCRYSIKAIGIFGEGVCFSGRWRPDLIKISWSTVMDEDKLLRRHAMRMRQMARAATGEEAMRRFLEEAKDSETRAAALAPAKRS